MAKSLTAASAVLRLTVASLYTTPVGISGFANDDAFSFDDIESAETVMGVDGVLSFGWVPAAVKQKIMLQADSDSNIFFEDWGAASKAARGLLIASGTVIYPAVQRQYTLVRGVLAAFKPAPDAGKILKPRSYSITWTSMIPSDYLGL